MIAPRCGKPMFQHKAANVYRYEAANGPMLDTPTCARPECHNGPCRSAASIARQRPKDIARVAEWQREHGRPWLIRTRVGSVA